MRRRDFLASVSVLPAFLVGAASVPGLAGRLRPGRATGAVPGRRLRVLMLGGTNFVGPHLVRAALARGHEVTLFNRGVTNPHLFPELEKLRGNRYPDRGRGLAALEGDRGWDAVIDTWQAEPGCVDVTARLLADRTDRYLYISSVATYRHYREVGMTEEGPFLDASEHIDSFDPELGYAIRKRAGEQAVERTYGERGTVLICTSIGGPSESPRAWNPAGYWSYRFLVGGPVLAPDDPTAHFQLIDVRDMAAFAVRAVERGFGGAYNMVGPEEPLTLPDYLRAWHEVTESRATLVWADPDWLLEQGLRPFEDIRNWIPSDDPEPGFYRISNRKAVGHGLTYRPLLETLRDGIAGAPDPAELEPPTVGMSRERELELVEAWRAERPH